MDCLVGRERAGMRALDGTSWVCHMPIERDFDIPFVAGLALREKQIQQNYRPVIAVHKWFARRPGTLGTRRAPGAVSRGMAGRFPCHLCLAVDRMGPGEARSQRGLNRGKPYAIAADRTGRHRA